MKKDVSGQLVEFALKTKYEALPEDAVQFAKWLLLKTIAGTLAGSTKPSAKKMARLIKSRKLPGEVGVIGGGGMRTSLWEAIILTGYFAHASEYEDDRVDESGAVSWDITVIPILLPLAEKLGLSGKKFLEVLVAGLEVHARTCRFNPGHLSQVLVPGAAGPAVAAAMALGLNFQQTTNALGLAISSVPLWTGSYGTDAHFFQSSLMCLQGVMSAEMAKLGMSGHADLATYLTQYLGSERVVPEKMVENLGKEWIFKEICIKKYPVCFMQHRQIDIVVAIKKENNLSFEEVETIEIYAKRSREEICNRPNPRNEGDLQFSFHHNLALAMLHGDVTLKYITPEAVNERDLINARKKVKFIADYSPSVTGSTMQEPAHVVVKMKDGRIFTKDRQYPIGHPKDQMATAQFHELCNKVTNGILKNKDMAKASEIISNLEKHKNVKELLRALGAGG